MKPTGDDHLSAFDHKLWSLHQQVLFKFNCYTIFKNTSYNVPAQTPGLIQWFVPKDHPLSYEVVAYLEHELEKEKLEPTQLLDVRLPGVNVVVAVMPYSGIEPYLERDKVEALAKQFASDFIQKLSKLNKEQKRGPEGPLDPAQKPTQ